MNKNITKPSLHKDAALTSELAKQLSRQIDKNIFEKKYAPAKDILMLVGAGTFLAASIAIPNLPKAIKPFLRDQNEHEAWKRFNIPYLQRTLRRLEKQKLIEITEEEQSQVIKITEAGKTRIIKYGIDTLVVEKPKNWDKTWRLVSYDIPRENKTQGEIFYEYLKAWRFYPLHKSVLLHAYPCEQQVEFLREYLGIGKYVRIFTITKIENDKQFRTFFNI